jgi:hypothetical protein
MLQDIGQVLARMLASAEGKERNANTSARGDHTRGKHTSAIRVTVQWCGDVLARPINSS